MNDHDRNWGWKTVLPWRPGGGPMDAPFRLICLVAALILAAFAGFGWFAPVEPYRTKLIGMSLFFYFCSLLVGR